MHSPDAGLKFLEAVIGQAAPSSPDGIEFNKADRFDAVLHTLTNFQASPGSVTCTFIVAPPLQNRNQTLHGGYIATIVDVVGTGALATLSNRAGVSVNINVDYLNAAPSAQECQVEARVVKVGKTLATINVEICFDQQGKKVLVAQGRHVKFMSAKEQGFAKQQPQLTTRSKL